MPRPRPPAKEGLAAPEPGVEGGVSALVEEEGLMTMVDTSLCGAGLFSSRDVDAVSLTGASSSSEVATVVSRGGGRGRGGGWASESAPGREVLICGTDEGIVSDASSCLSCCCCC